jgi:intracellular sulfur oxidation DsrE/DsrF family protein
MKRAFVFTAMAVYALAMVFVFGVRVAQAADIPAGYYTDQKVVYQNDGGLPDNTSYFYQLLKSIRNHITAVGKDHLDIRVVDFGAGVSLFRQAKTDKDLAALLDGLRADHVRFLLCANTLRAGKIDWHELYGVQEDDIVPSGVAELARLQSMGFVYIRL